MSHHHRPDAVITPRRAPCGLRALSPAAQITIGLGLALLLAATRGRHLPTLDFLPGASWAVFFIAGVYLRPSWVLPALLAETWLLDLAAYLWGDGSGFCLTAAYVFLLPAYGALWAAGRWYAGRHRFTAATVVPLTAGVLGGSALSELFSSGGFYFFSGRFADPTLAEFAVRVQTYYPTYLLSLSFYVGLAALLHIALTLTRHAPNARARTS